jgi:hypothetical protein
MENNLEWLRTDYLSGGGMFGPFLSPDELRNSKLYIETMENFITSSEDGEVASLAERIGHLTPEQQDDFWQDNYPIHWKEIFATRIRTSFVIQLCSLVESQIDEVCKRITLIARVPLKLRDLKGSTLEKGRRYMEAFGGFTTPSVANWSVVGKIFVVRNLFVHERGFMEQLGIENKIVEFARVAPGLKMEHNVIELEPAFCEYCLTSVEIFLGQLRESYETFRIQRQLLEKLDAPKRD